MDLMTCFRTQIFASVLSNSPLNEFIKYFGGGGIYFIVFPVPVRIGEPGEPQPVPVLFDHCEPGANRSRFFQGNCEPVEIYLGLLRTRCEPAGIFLGQLRTECEPAWIFLGHLRTG